MTYPLINSRTHRLVSRWKKISPRIRRAFGETAIAAALYFIDPLGLSSQRAFSVDHFFARLLEQHYHSTARSALAVVLIDEPSLDHWQTDWPITQGHIAEIIHVLACAHVAAVFFDFTLSGRFYLATGHTELEKAVHDSSRTGLPCRDGKPPNKVPAFFGVVEDPSIDSGEAYRLRDISFWITWQGAPGIYPAGRMEFPDPLEDRDVTPAFGLARQICSFAAINREALGSFCTAVPHPANLLAPIRLTWSDEIDPQQAQVAKLASCRPTPEQASPIWTTFLSAFSRVRYALGLESRSERQRCPPILTLTGEDLDRDYSYIHAYGDPMELLSGRIVFVGVRLPGISDFIASPIHGPMPGVYAHAVALDNLLTFGDRYETKPDLVQQLAVAVTYYFTMQLARDMSPQMISILLQILISVILVSFVRLLNQWPWSLAVMLIVYYLPAWKLMGPPARPHSADATPVTVRTPL